MHVLAPSELQMDPFLPHITLHTHIFDANHREPPRIRHHKTLPLRAQRKVTDLITETLKTNRPTGNNELLIELCKMECENGSSLAPSQQRSERCFRCWQPVGVECCFNRRRRRRRRLAILRGLDSECPHKLSRTVNWTYRRIIQLYRSTTSQGLYRHSVRRSRRKNPNWWVSNFELCGRLTRRVTLLTIYWTQQLVVNLLAHARHVPSTLVLWPAAAICCPRANHNTE